MAEDLPPRFAGGTLYYTLDGSDAPTSDGIVAGELYGTPLSLEETTTISVRVKDGDRWSGLVRGQYVIADAPANAFTAWLTAHHLTDSQGDPGGDGLNILAEYAFGGDPMRKTPAPVIALPGTAKATLAIHSDPNLEAASLRNGRFVYPGPLSGCSFVFAFATPRHELWERTDRQDFSGIWIWLFTSRFKDQGCALIFQTPELLRHPDSLAKSFFISL